MRVNRYILFMLFLMFIAQAVAQQKPMPINVVAKKAAVLRLDSSKVDQRQFNAGAIKVYSKQKEFIYDDVAPQGQNWWDRFWRWLWAWIERAFNGLLSSKGAGGIIKYLLIALVIGIVVFVAIKLMGLDYRLLIGKSKHLEVPFSELLVNIHEVDFDAEIANGLQAGNYRLVVRLLYLQTLKRLSDQGMINWQPEKTNRTYVMELTDENLKLAFEQLTTQFEYIWYGEFLIDQLAFEPIHQSFQQFNQKMA